MSNPTNPESSSPQRRRYKLLIAYDGSAFRGWQKQFPPPLAPLTPQINPPQAASWFQEIISLRPAPRTVAAVLEEAMQLTLQQPVKIVGSSRTDAGVHALGQVAHFDATTRIPVARLALAINSRLPPDVQVLSAVVVPDTFDAISDAVAKQYRYRIFNAPHRPLAVRHLVYHCWRPLDVDAMADAAARLVGTHDFEGFASADHDRESTVRTIFDCHIQVHPLTTLASTDFYSPQVRPTPPPSAPPEPPEPPEATETTASPESPDAAAPLMTGPEGHRFEPREVHIVVSGSGFLYNMVRIIAGTLVEVGWGRFTPQIVDQILASRDRRQAGTTLAPNGLCLEWIRHAPLPENMENCGSQEPSHG
ncbi:MAG: tRNA pseudouridine synthase A [Phycisphaeraceae bacterium]|nr:tRNA pseudouridine synthase A [Phycisphaeraceae bacterium]